MRTFSLVKGQPVFNRQNGTKIGEVCDLWITDTGVVKGLLIKNGSFFKQTAFLSIEKVSSFGSDGIMVDGSSQLEKLKIVPEYTLAHHKSLVGKMLFSKEGDALGILEDVYFQEELGTIVGYEVTDGFFTDITEGKQVINTQMPPAIGKDAIIVDVNDT